MQVIAPLLYRLQSPQNGRSHIKLRNTMKSKVSTTLNRGIKGTEKLKGPFKQNCTYLDHDVQPPHTSITIDVHHRKIFI